MSDLSGFRLDLRSLALGRILIALVLLYDLFDRARYLSQHYGPQGLVPPGQLSTFSFHAVSEPLLLLLFIIHFTAALCLLLGKWTRAATFVGWLLLLSLHLRNRFVVYGADNVLLLSLFWGCFLPWGARWSVDARRQTKGPSASWSGPAAVVWVGQVAVLYLCTALAKSGAPWTGGTAVSFVLANNQLETQSGRWVLGLVVAAPWLGKVATWSVLLCEFAIPVLLLFGKRRNLAVALIVALHLTLALTVDLGIFPWVCLAQGLSLLEGPAVKTKDHKPQPDLPAWLGVAVSFLFLLSACTGFLNAFRLPNPLSPLLRPVGLVQNWDMFAPGVPTTHGWYSVRGTAWDGSRWELLLLDRAHWSDSAPQNLTRSLGGARASMVPFAVFVRRDQEAAELLLSLLYRNWQRDFPELSLRSVELLYYASPIRPGQAVPAKETVVLQQQFAAEPLGAFSERESRPPADSPAR